MSWTVACFCGNVYTAPPARCNICNRRLSRTVTDAPAAIAPVPDTALASDRGLSVSAPTTTISRQQRGS
jgi:hypothetical protein